MNLKMIKVADAHQSETNVKGRDQGKDFDELVASVKEKGIITPVLARPIKGGYEVVAGNRRLAAAVKLGLKEIPAYVIDMTDVEAREYQIVENLQRAGIHPIDEGEQYRELIEEAKYDTQSVAAKVGKTESYVKQRLFLTNLVEKAREDYKKEKIIDGHAVLIAKLSSDDQLRALKAVNDRWNRLSVKELKEWIEKNIYSPLERQPWMGNKELEAVVGKCIECEPEKASLFGPVKEGECTSLKCWHHKLVKYIDYMAKEKKYARISSEYGQAPKGVKNRSEYTIVAKKGKDRCESVHPAIVVQGSEIGHVFDICSDKDCKLHGSNQTQYGLTPKEAKERKESRKKELADAKKAKESREKKLTAALEKIEWPMPVKHLDALLELCLEHANSNLFRNVAKRHELEVEKEKNSWGSTSWRYDLAVRKYVKGLDNVGKLRLAFELLIDTGYDSLRNSVSKIS